MDAQNNKRGEKMEDYKGEISITPDGTILQRNEVVDYLKRLSEHILIQNQLEIEAERFREKLAELTKVSKKKILPPEPNPPIQDPYPILPIIVCSVFGFIFLKYTEEPMTKKIVYASIVICMVVISIAIHYHGNRRAMKDWQNRKAAYEQEQKRISSLNSTASPQDSDEVLDVKQKLKSTEEVLEKVIVSRQCLDGKNILADDYRQNFIPCVLYEYFMKGRVNTLSEAINLFHLEMHQSNMLQQQQQMAQEIAMHQDAMLLQQQLNTERLASQIHDAKNEIEFQIALDSMYTTEMLESLRRELMSY
jgi:hypothetical protein